MTRLALLAMSRSMSPLALPLNVIGICHLTSPTVVDLEEGIVTPPMTLILASLTPLPHPVAVVAGEGGGG